MEYDIILTGKIEWRGTIDAESAALAIDEARQELRVNGDISDIEVERAVLSTNDLE